MSDFNNGTDFFNSIPNPEGFHTNPSNPVPQQPNRPPKKPKTALLIVLAIVVVLLGGSITAFACVPSISNQVYLAVLNPKKYYLKIEEKAIEDMSNSISSAYGRQMKLVTNGPYATSSNMKFTINDDYLSALGLTEVFPLELNTTTSVDIKNNKEKIFGELLLGNESFGSVNMLMDLSKENYGSLFLQIPELSDSYIGYTSSEVLNEATANANEEEAEMVKQMQAFYGNFYEEPTSEKLVKQLLSRYANIIVNNVNNVTLDKNINVSANGVTAKNTKIVVTMDAKELKNISTAFINTAKNDTDLKNELIRLEACTEEQYNTAMDDAAAAIAEMDENSADKFTMTVWVDKNGTITGRDFTVETSDEDPVTASYHTVKQKNTTNIEYSQAADGVTNLIIKGKNINEKGVSNGDFTAELGGGGTTNYSAAVTYDSFKTTNKDLGYFSGNFTFSITQLPSVSLKVTATGTDKDQKLLFEAIAIGANIGSLEVTTAKADFEDFTFPDSQQVYKMTDSDAMNTYLSNVNQEYVEKVQNKIIEIGESISNVFGGSDGPTSIFPGISSEDTEDDIIGDSDDSSSLILDSFDETDDDTSLIDDDTDDDTTETSQTSDGFTINKNPATKDDLPFDAEVDADGYYSYYLTDDQVMANGEPSTIGDFYPLVFSDIKDDLYQIITETINETWEEDELISYNSVTGELGSEDLISTYFVTTSQWTTSSASFYNSFSVNYDTFDKKISEFTISVASKEELYTIIQKLLSLTEDNFTEKDFEKIVKKLDKVKSENDVSFEFGNSRIYVSATEGENENYYCSISAKSE